MKNDHELAKYLLIANVVELMAKEYKIPLSDARDRLYQSDIISLIEDNERGLFGESPWYVFSLYESHLEKNNKKIEKRT